MDLGDSHLDFSVFLSVKLKSILKFLSISNSLNSIKIKTKYIDEGINIQRFST